MIFPKTFALDPHWYNPVSPGHDLSHTYRVMWWAKRLSIVLLSIDPSEVVNIACTCAFAGAIIHDMGRFNGLEEPTHGQIAADTKMFVLKELYGDTIPTSWYKHIHFAVSGHSKADKYGKDELSNLTMRILKDSDGLDRVRCDDIDPKYLRLSFTKQFIPMAEALYNEFPEPESFEELDDFRFLS